MSVRLIVGLLALTSMAACTWVEPDSRGAQVQVATSPTQVLDCRDLGTVSASVKATILGVERNPAKVRDEVESLARNQASTMRANTIRASSDLVDGAQEFRAYDCPNRR